MNGAATPQQVPYGEVDAAVAYPQAPPPSQDLNDRRKVHWSCPRCGHPSTTELRWGWAAALDGEAGAEPQPRWCIVYCRCSEHHPAAPAEPASNGIGCGCYVDVEVLW